MTSASLCSVTEETGPPYTSCAKSSETSGPPLKRLELQHLHSCCSGRHWRQVNKETAPARRQGEGASAGEVYIMQQKSSERCRPVKGDPRLQRLSPHRLQTLSDSLLFTTPPHSQDPEKSLLRKNNNHPHALTSGFPTHLHY